jgi:RHS repeat-associated protein
VGAGFALNPPLNVTLTGSGIGAVTSSPAGINCGQACSLGFAPNTTITLTASPGTGSTFQGWLGVCTGTALTCVVTLNQAQNLFAEFSAPAIASYQYDSNGNLTQAADPLGNTRQIQYDSLDQPIQQLEPHPTAIGSTLGQISTAHDNLGQATQIIDPRNLSTSYQMDNLGNLLGVTSPDTGSTQNTYDDAGDLITQTDARGQAVTYSYDSQNRLTQMVYADQTIAYTWDNCTNGIERLCGLTNAGISLNFSYDLHGRVTSKTQTVGTITQNTTPSGQALGYVWLNDHLQSITLNGQSLITQITYDPDGQITGWTWGNGSTSTRQYDLNGRPVAVSLGFDPQNQLQSLRNFTYDAAGKITGIADSVNPVLDQVYAYDGLDRLISGQQGVFTLTDLGYSYDLSGNRTAKTQNNSTPETDGIDPGSNRLLQTTAAQTVTYSYDATGHVTSDGTITYSFNGQGRRTSATSSTLTANYSYNGLGQRVSKTVNGYTTLFFYDSRGQLAGEYNATGQLIQETVWLGNLPIATLRPNSIQPTLVNTFYVHSDHLATPRKISRVSDNAVMWTWESEAFGNSLDNKNPSGQGAFAYNLRFPGQYYDQETGLYYNWNRYYDPKTGRYPESDPIGLAGGVNTYTYVNNNPLRYIDPLGLSGTLIINSNGTNDGSSGSGGLSGHSWISYTPDGGSTTTYGTWGNNPIGLGNGLFQNLEVGRTGEATRSTHLNDDEEAQLKNIINAYRKQGDKGWKYLSPCSSFASDAWNGATGESLSPYGPYSNPSSLKNSIIDANGGVSNGSR